MNLKTLKTKLFNNWFSIYIENPFKTWWKVRKYFKCPNLTFHFGIGNISSYCSPHTPAKILNINIHDVWWKDKWNTPRHEYNPQIFIQLFSIFTFAVTCKIEYCNEFGEKREGDMEYWEYILDYLYYRKTLKCYPTWTAQSQLYKQIKKYGNAEDGSEDKYEPVYYPLPCVAMSLNKAGIKKLKEELNGKENSI